VMILAVRFRSAVARRTKSVRKAASVNRSSASFMTTN
jgi:hypothetical protein